MIRKLWKSEDGSFFFALFAWMCFCWFRYFERTMEFYNTTLFALSYSYGFISRGLLGTMWELLDKITPMSLMNYRSVYLFHIGVSILYELVVFLLFVTCYRMCGHRQKPMMRYLICFLAVFAYPMFLSEEMFGRLDVYLYILVLIGVLCILKEKWEWVILPIGLICICIHQGFVFINANIILVLLLYKAITRKEKRKKYIALFIGFLVLISAFFCYFEFFSHVNGTEIADEITTNAKLLSEDGESYNETIVRHEILGEDVFQDEMKYHIYNYEDFPVFLLLFAPYIVIGLHFFIRLFRTTESWNRLMYLIIFVGAGTILPQMILKVDYGRYMFSTFFYYILVVMVLFAMGDIRIGVQLENTKCAIKERTSVPLVLLVYPVFLTPFYDVIISGPVHWLAQQIFHP